MLEIEKRNTCGPTRAGKRHVPSRMRSFAALSSLVHASRGSRSRGGGRTPQRQPARPVDPEEAVPAAASCNNRLCRRSPIAASAANLQPNLSFRLKCRFGLTVGGGRPALIERPRPTLGPKSRSAVRTSASSADPFLEDAGAGPSSEREACSGVSAPRRSSL